MKERLRSLINGRRETVNGHTIDVATDNLLVEVKRQSQWKTGLGSLLGDAELSSARRPVLYLYGPDIADWPLIQATCKSQHVAVLRDRKDAPAALIALNKASVTDIKALPSEYAASSTASAASTAASVSAASVSTDKPTPISKLVERLEGSEVEVCRKKTAEDLDLVTGMYRNLAKTNPSAAAKVLEVYRDLYVVLASLMQFETEVKFDRKAGDQFAADALHYGSGLQMTEYDLLQAVGTWCAQRNYGIKSRVFIHVINTLSKTFSVQDGVWTGVGIKPAAQPEADLTDSPRYML